MSLRSLTLLFAALGFAGCANPYSTFYKGAPDARALPEYIPQSTPLQIYSSDNFQRDVQLLTRRGYAVIGGANFNAAVTTVSEKQLQDQATKLGAHVVLVASQYSHTVSGAMPVTVPKTSTSYTTTTATAYGPGGIVTAQGNGTTTTYGSQTVVVPYSVQRYDFGALFLIKRKWTLGVQMNALDDDTRRRLESNKGVVVTEVVEGTPAFLADILPGDVILNLADQPAISVEHVTELIAANAGRTVLVVLDRNGKQIKKTISLESAH